MTGTITVPRCGVSAPTDWNLDANFFAAQLFEPTLEIRIQHGGDLIEFADGVVLRISNYGAVTLGVALPVADATVLPDPTVVPDPAVLVVDAAPYLNRMCADVTPLLVSVTGTVTFNSMYSAADPRIAGSFSIDFVDPVYPGATAHLTGEFNFLFRRGQPAEHFS